MINENDLSLINQLLSEVDKILENGFYSSVENDSVVADMFYEAGVALWKAQQLLADM